MSLVSVHHYWENPQGQQFQILYQQAPGDPRQYEFGVIDEPGHTVQWDFGDGTQATTPSEDTCDHTFPGPGTYQVEADCHEETASTTLVVDAPVYNPLMYYDMAVGVGANSPALTSLPDQWTIAYKFDPALATQLMAGQEWDWFAAYEGRLSGNDIVYANHSGGDLSVVRLFNSPEMSGGYLATGFDPANPARMPNLHWWSSDGTTWTQITSTGTTRAPEPPQVSSVPVGFGREGYGSSPKGHIFWIEMRQGLTPGEGDLIWRFDANDVTGDTYTDPRGREWSVTQAAVVEP